jgi:hypothetical protein
MSAIPNVTVFATAPGVVDLAIIITPTGRRSGHFDARLEGGRVIVKASRQPFLDAAMWSTLFAFTFLIAVALSLASIRLNF